MIKLEINQQEKTKLKKIKSLKSRNQILSWYTNQQLKQMDTEGPLTYGRRWFLHVRAQMDPSWKTHLVKITWKERKNTKTKQKNKVVLAVAKRQDE